ncbi:flagellar basal body P-ring formation chaperone FlgA [Uliginosibacterium sp. sgz301328]|uniref:flagellar basal body P-ring formation chaperone FlgA n=1 Tax=Uliginosibacterium sp. sgz301328 TaxID=3243764 RepID=UPI00359F3FE6
MRMPFTSKFTTTQLLACAATVTAVLCAQPARADAMTEVERAARTQLMADAQRAGLVEPQFTFEVVSAARTPRACAKPFEITLADRRTPARMRAIAHCPDGNWAETYTVRARVNARVVVAAGSIPSGRAIQPNDLALERRELTGTFDDVFSDPAELNGQASRRALRAGQIVDRRAVAEAVLVRRGADVSIVARNSGIVVTTAGQAEGNGRLGEIISVRNAATGKVIRARVTGTNEVEPATIATTP